MLERYLSYEPLTPVRFLEITDRFESVLFASLPRKPRILGTSDETGNITKEGKPMYEVLIDWRQRADQRRITLVHETVHIGWEEGILHDALASLNYNDVVSAMAELHVTHEARVEKEARRFFAQERDLVEAVYISLGLKRRNRFNTLS